MKEEWEVKKEEKRLISRVKVIEEMSGGEVIEKKSKEGRVEVSTTIKLPYELWKRAKMEAVERGVTFTNVVRAALEEKVKNDDARFWMLGKGKK